MATGQTVRALLNGLDADPTPVERLLLATDGTVTHMLEALTDSPVEVEIKEREVSDGTLTRHVILRNGDDGTPLVSALSKVNLYPLNMDIENELVHGDMGIGDLLRQEFVDTHREITDMAHRRDGHYLAFAGPALERTYDIYSDGDRLMTITEWFPKGAGDW